MSCEAAGKPAGSPGAWRRVERRRRAEYAHLLAARKSCGAVDAPGFPNQNSQASLWKGFSHQAQRAELLRQVIFRLKPADAEKDRIVRAEKRFHLRRQHRVRWNPHWRIGKNQTQPLLRNPAASIEIDNFLVNADQPVKSPKHKTSKCSRVCPAAWGEEG